MNSSPIICETAKLDVSFQIDSSFLRNTITQFIQLKNPFCNKTDFESEPKNLRIIVTSQGISSIEKNGVKIKLEIPVDVKVIKRFKTKLVDYQLKEINFSISIFHEFSVEITPHFEIHFASHASHVEWRERPIANIFYFKIDISKMVKPLILEHLNRILEEIYPYLSKMFQERMRHTLQVAIPELCAPIGINGRFLQIQVKKVILENHILSNSKDFKIYAGLHFSIHVADKKEDLGQFKKVPSIEIGNVEEDANLLATTSFINLGEYNEEQPFTVNLSFLLPHKNLLRAIFPRGCVLLDEVELACHLKVYIDGDITIYKDVNSKENEISFHIRMPLHIWCCKLSVVRECKVCVDYLLQLGVSDEGVVLRKCKGEWYWIQKPDNYKIFDIQVVNVVKQVEKKVHLRIEEVQKLITDGIQKQVEKLSENTFSCLIFPNLFKNDSVELGTFYIDNQKLGIFFDKKLSRHLQLKAVQLSETTKWVGRYQLPITIKEMDDIKIFKPNSPIIIDYFNTKNEIKENVYIVQNYFAVN